MFEDLTTKDYKEMIEKASKRNIWFYKGMEEKYLPYVLLVNYGIFEKNKFHKEKTYFVFDSKLSNYDDLWIRNGKIKQKIWKVTPNLHDLEEIEIDFDNSEYAPYYFLPWVTGLKDLPDLCKW
ncbi:hypothetical protein [Virgibacillus sp. Bac330]|uniref:hypothetical protein n=1 Tax=Virgibacillus sp. Bac330 TaxID=2419841 RepID=UPI000EF51935|nr:hypothetical protein [Virgibacillus sp. Bac330]